MSRERSLFSDVIRDIVTRIVSDGCYQGLGKVGMLILVAAGLRGVLKEGPAGGGFPAVQRPTVTPGEQGVDPLGIDPKVDVQSTQEAERAAEERAMVASEAKAEAGRAAERARIAAEAGRAAERARITAEAERARVAAKAEAWRCFGLYVRQEGQHLIVTGVRPGSPACRMTVSRSNHGMGGIEDQIPMIVDDTIEAVNGFRISTVEEFYSVIASIPSGGFLILEGRDASNPQRTPYKAWLQLK